MLQQIDTYIANLAAIAFFDYQHIVTSALLFLALFVIAFCNFPEKVQIDVTSARGCFFKLIWRSSTIFLAPTLDWYVYLTRAILFLIFPFLFHLLNRLLVDSNLHHVFTFFLIVILLTAFVYFRRFPTYVYKLAKKKYPLSSVRFQEYKEKTRKNVRKTHYIPTEGVRRTGLIHSLFALFWLSIITIFVEPLYIEEFALLTLKATVIVTFFLVLLCFISYRGLFFFKEHSLTELAVNSNLFNEGIGSPAPDSTVSSRLSNSVEHPVMGLDKLLLRQLYIMIRHKDFKYPSNWQRFIWDYSKLLMNFAIVNSILHIPKSSRFVFQNQVMFYVFLLFPSIVVSTILVSLPFWNNWPPISSTGIDEPKLLMTLLAMTALPWMWMSYRDLLKYQLWHYFKNPYALKRYPLEEYEFGHLTLNNKEREDTSRDFIEYIHGKGKNVLQLLLLVFLPAYLTFLGVF